MSTSHHDGAMPYSEDLHEALKNMQEKASGFPQGKLNPQDEGNLVYAVAVDKTKGVVVLQFPKLVGWLGLPRRDAIKLANKLTSLAEQLPG